MTHDCSRLRYLLIDFKNEYDIWFDKKLGCNTKFMLF